MQQQQINDLEVKAIKPVGINSSNGASDSFSMDQNIPNPFDGVTVINYHLPQSAGSAYMVVYDLSGKQVADFTLQKDAPSLCISSEKLAAGIYIYSIIADGKIMDSKRMVVTQKK